MEGGADKAGEACMEGDAAGGPEHATSRATLRMSTRRTIR
jgi:hypothetical protein